MRIAKVAALVSVLGFSAGSVMANDHEAAPGTVEEVEGAVTDAAAPAKKEMGKKAEHMGKKADKAAKHVGKKMEEVKPK